MVIHTPAAVAVPLRTDEGGAIRVGSSRVTLMTVVGRYNAGDTASDIHENFPTVTLSEVYAVLAYYLANREMIDAYIARIREGAEQDRAAWEARYTPEQKALTDRVRHKMAEKYSNEEA
ncbi:MAG: DUF433 domain-containing protein [Chloroflexota bacterium]